ncbi:MAG TPA: CPBP family intramembrane glutamic endopeptidase [Steroidobacteraceae bacterium]|nr:CPBP family intramembrane glutamic endopeptidase [Steroidobacteraceae bacterium]
MRSFAIFLGLIALGLAAIAALGYPAWLLTQAMGLEFKFHRVASRIAMLALLAGFVFVARRLRVADRRSLGYGLPARKFVAEAAKALVLGALLMLPVLATMVALDMRELKPGVSPDAAGWLKLMGLGLGSGLAVALIEETFLRGAMQSAIARESGAVPAIVLTALLYAATHFIGRYRVAAADVHAGSGLDMLAGALASFTHPLGIVDAFLCLTSVGILLGLVRHYTGNIAACIGLHAGWVAVISVVRETSERNPHGPANWLMSDYDGFIGWMVLGWTLVIGAVLWWWYGRAAVSRGENAASSPGH